MLAKTVAFRNDLPLPQMWGGLAGNQPEQALNKQLGTGRRLKSHHSAGWGNAAPARDKELKMRQFEAPGNSQDGAVLMEAALWGRRHATKMTFLERR